MLPHNDGFPVVTVGFIQFVIHSRRTPLLLRALISILPIFMLGSTPRYRLNNALDGTLLLKVFLLGNGRNWRSGTCILLVWIHGKATTECSKLFLLYAVIRVVYGLPGTDVFMTPLRALSHLPLSKRSRFSTTTPVLTFFARVINTIVNDLCLSS